MSNFIFTLLLKCMKYFVNFHANIFSTNIFVIYFRNFIFTFCYKPQALVNTDSVKNITSKLKIDFYALFNGCFNIYFFSILKKFQI